MENQGIQASNHPGSEAEILSNKEIIKLLKQQNELLDEIADNLTKCMVDDNHGYYVRNKIIDFEMSIGSMVIFIFKWIIASIPVTIMLIIIYLALIGLGVKLFIR